MRENWTDFEKYMFHAMGRLDSRLSKLEGRASVWGAVAGIIGAAVIEAIFKVIQRS